MDIIVIFFVAGLMMGCVITHTREARKRKPFGTLRVDSSDPDGPYLFLELETNPEIIKKEKYITLKVDTKSYISQK